MGIEQTLAFGFGVVLVLILLLVALKYPYPTEFQYLVLRVALSLACACVAIFITGFLTVTIKEYLQAGGALAVFVIVYFYAPAALPQYKGWIELRSIWQDLRDIHTDIHTDPKQVNIDDVVKAINAVNNTANIIDKQPRLTEQFRSEYAADFCKLFLKLRDGEILIPHEEKTSNLLLNISAAKLATQLEC